MRTNTTRRLTNVRLIQALEQHMLENPGLAPSFNALARASLDAFVAAEAEPLGGYALAGILGDKVGRPRSVAMAPELFAHYDHYACAHGVSFSALVNSALVAALLCPSPSPSDE